jgi:uncharacterized membrane protein YbhN (UPF0104 family)
MPEGVEQERSRAWARRFAATAILVTLLGVMAFQLATEREQLAAFKRVSVGPLLVALGLQVLAQLFWNSAMLAPLKTHLSTLGFWELFLVRTGGFIAGYAVPVAGTLAVRMAYLKRRGLGYADFTWATAMTSVLTLAAGAVLGVVALAALWMMTDRPPLPVLALGAGCLALGVAGMAGFQVVRRLAGSSRLERWPWLAALSQFETRRSTLISVSGFSLARHVCNYLTFGVLYQALAGTPTALWAGGLVYAITSPIRMVNFTPGNLGINEWVVAVVGKALAFDVTMGLMAALLFRGLNMASQTVGVVIGAAWLSRSGRDL